MKIIERFIDWLAQRRREKQFRCKIDFRLKDEEQLLLMYVDDICSCFINNKINCTVLKDELRRRGYRFNENGDIKL